MITVEDVEVSGPETEIIEPQETPSDRDRYFGIANNGDNKILVKAWGSNDGESWIEKDSKEIAANRAATLIVGPTVCWVKLTGGIMPGPGQGLKSTVDACLYY